MYSRSEIRGLAGTFFPYQEAVSGVGFGSGLSASCTTFGDNFGSTNHAVIWLLGPLLGKLEVKKNKNKFIGYQATSCSFYQVMFEGAHCGVHYKS